VTHTSLKEKPTQKKDLHRDRKEVENSTRGITGTRFNRIKLVNPERKRTYDTGKEHQ
jgi:hypothetical protein